MRLFVLAALLMPGLFGQTTISAPAKAIEIELPDVTPPDQAAPAPNRAETPQSKTWVMKMSGKDLVINTTQPASVCAIPLLNAGSAQSFHGDPKIELPKSERAIDPKMVIKAMPICPKR